MQQRKPYGMNEAGFTIVELGLVLIIAGLIVGLAAAGWSSMQYTRRLAAARATLEAVNICLQNHVLGSSRIPDQNAFEKLLAAKPIPGRGHNL